MPYNRSTLTTPGPSKQCIPNPCPSCGGLECLCRPRFFAGQLLTEDDLNRLEGYMLHKNNLHNRYLFGWGVVCGLEVICSPCAGQVTVTSGYALSPCGEDVIVCCDDTVNVCDLIKQCQIQRQPNCDPPAARNTGREGELTEQWVLAIRYQEKPSKGMMPLKNSGSSCSRCGGTSLSCSRCGGSNTGCSRCGGSGAACSGGSSCNCGCHSSTSNGGYHGGYKTTPKTTAPQCEPTVICEGYVYEVYKLPPHTFDRGDPGPLLKRVMECMQEFGNVFNSLSLENSRTGNPMLVTSNSVQPLATWLRALKSSVQNLLEILPIYDCGFLAQRLANIGIPNTTLHTANISITDFAEATNQLLEVTGIVMRYCICSALLPPCPDPVHDPRIPLATITVSKEQCEIIEVCNLDTRKIVPTLPNLEYWFSPVLQILLTELHFAIEKDCCNGFFSGPPLLKTNENRLFAANLTSQPASNINPTSQLLSQVFANTGRTIDTRLLALGALGITDEQGKKVMSDLELQNPAAFLLLNQFVQPMLSALLPEQALRAFSASVPSEATAASAQGEQISKLQAEVSALQETLKQQQDIISQLQKRLNG